MLLNKRTIFNQRLRLVGSISPQQAVAHLGPIDDNPVVVSGVVTMVPPVAGVDSRGGLTEEEEEGGWGGSAQTLSRRIEREAGPEAAQRMEGGQNIGGERAGYRTRGGVSGHRRERTL